MVHKSFLKLFSGIKTSEYSSAFHQKSKINGQINCKKTTKNFQKGFQFFKLEKILAVKEEKKSFTFPL